MGAAVDTSASPAVVPAPFGHLVEQLWAPALADGRVRVVSRGTPSDGWTVAEEYYAVPSLERATMLLPAGDRGVTVGSLLNYKGLRRRVPNAQRTVLGGAVRLGGRLPFPRVQVQVRDPEAVDTLPLSHVARALGLDEVRASVGVRTGANRKATLQLVDRHGAPVGFAKLGWSAPSDEAVEREAAALAVPTAGQDARSPELLATGSYGGHPFLVSSPLPLDATGVRADVPPPTPQELAALAPLVRRAPLGTSDQLVQLRRRAAALPTDPAADEVRPLLDRLLDALLSSDELLPITARWHGDLTPWNSARDRAGVLWCWDWESSEPDAVAGLDSLYWHVTVQTEAGANLDVPTVRRAAGLAAPHLVAVGVPRRARGLVLGVYVATMAERACALAAGPGGWEPDWVLPHQLAELLRHALDEVADGRTDPA